MIKNLSIQNYALIENLEMDLFSGFNIITGETGAGKSILLGSLELLMGKRADYSVLYDENKKCIVEAEFDISEYKLESFFEENDLDYDKEIIIRRVISPNGKSRAFINDEPVNLTTLKEFSSKLIQMHRQFDNLQISSPDYQLKLIDEFGEITQTVEKYRSKYLNFKNEQKELDGLLEKDKDFKAQMEFWNFQYKELSEALPTIEKYEEVQNLFNNLSNSENIQLVLNKAYNELSEGEYSINSRLDALLNDMIGLNISDKKFDQVKEKFVEGIELLRESANEFVNIADRFEYDEAEIQELKNELDNVNALVLKYKVSEPADLIELKNDLQNKLKEQFDVESGIKMLEEKLRKDKKELLEIANKLSVERQKAAKKIKKSIEGILNDLAMPYAELIIDFKKSEILTSKGIDNIEFLFSANKGSVPKPIKDVASGGELSRLALAIESTIADKMSLPTMIFDEIEAGISGEVARKMGVLLQNLSKKHQLISITHSPQIASAKGNHYFVYKIIEGQKTKTGIKLLSEKERILELAKMLSGDPPSQSAIKNAEELFNKN